MVVLDVPYLAQREALCGGAAAAMVLRYWGAADVEPEDFASLVEGAPKGITTSRLTEAVKARGFDAHPLAADAASIAHHVALGRPVVALLDAGGGRLHYVVVLAWANGRVLLHDPAVGPYRVWSEASFLQAWRVTGGWALLALPTTPPGIPKMPEPEVTPEPGPCQVLIDAGVTLGRGADPEAAVPALGAAVELCPNEARPLLELAGVRFREERWAEAAGLAARASALAPMDADGWRLLGASRFLADQQSAALVAWNQAAEPRIDRIRIEGLRRTRQQVVLAFLGLEARELLTPESLALAARRLAELPSASGTALSYRPSAEGRADVVASVSEPGLLDPLPVLLLRTGSEALTEQELRIPVYSLTGGGDRLEVGGRFASQRPAFWASLASPRTSGLPGVFALRGFWDRQTYQVSGTGAALRETRRGAALDWSDWRGSSLRLHAGVGIDRWQGVSTDASFHAGAEARWLDDRLAARGELGSWLPLGSARAFEQLGGGLAFRSGTTQASGPRLTARFDGERVTSSAPLGLWPGAGTGTARPWLLRAYPLLRDGVVTGEAFGRGLLHASVELESPALRFSLVQLGFACFSDWARAFDRPGRPGAGPGLTALGAGLRLRLPGNGGAFRLDAATRAAGAGLTVSAAWMPAWPH